MGKPKPDAPGSPQTHAESPPPPEGRAPVVKPVPDWVDDRLKEGAAPAAADQLAPAALTEREAWMAARAARVADAVDAALTAPSYSRERGVK